MKLRHARLSRRKFLLGIAAGTAAGAAAVVTSDRSAAPAQQTQADGKQGYQLTEHVRNYYRTARI